MHCQYFIHFTPVPNANVIWVPLLLNQQYWSQDWHTFVILHQTDVDYQEGPDGYSYKMHHLKQDWHTAEDICKREGAHLVMEKSNETRAYVSSHWKNTPSVNFKKIFTHIELYGAKLHPFPCTFHQKLKNSFGKIDFYPTDRFFIKNHRLLWFCIFRSGGDITRIPFCQGLVS